MRLFIAAVMFVLISLGCVVGDLPHPLPRPGKESQPVQNPGQDEKQKIAEHDRPTKHFVTFINQTATVHAAQVEPDPGSNPGQQSSDNRVVWLTGALVFVGIAQIVVYAIQAFYMYRGLKVTREAADAATESAAVARETLQITQRAYLGIEVEAWRFKCDDAGMPIRIECVFYNSGATPAEVIGSDLVVYEVYVRGKLPPPPDYSHVPIESPKPRLMHARGGYTESLILEDVFKKAGPWVPITQSVDRSAWHSDMLKSILQGTTPFYVGGYVVYKTLGLCRLFVFLAQYEAAPLDRFVSVGESAYNYEISYNCKKERA